MISTMMLTDLLLTFCHSQFPPLSSAHRAQNGMFDDDRTIAYIIVYKMTYEYLIVLSNSHFIKLLMVNKLELLRLKREV